MARELPRTLHSLSEQYQRHDPGVRWDIVVLDNGSEPPVDEHVVRTILPNARIIRPDVVVPSPVAAINAAMAQLDADLLGLWIDGARLASPGIIHHAIEAWRSDSTRAIGTVAFHLGNDVQMRTVAEGYDRDLEDALLDSVPWKTDGYSLFEISTLAGSSSSGWFGCLSETNGLFLDRRLWNLLGGLDERFESAGGGLANLDLWERAVEASNGQPWIILGEGTFHQVHGGVATNGPAEHRDAMRSEYAAIRGRPFATPTYLPQFVGALDEQRFSKGSGRPLDRLRKAHSIRQRHFRVDLPTKALNDIQKGTLRTKYKGLRLAKSPFDLALYARVIERLRPSTIVEIGTSEGGSAVWMMDQCRAFGLSDTRLITIDIAPPQLEVAAVSFHHGDSHAPEQTFPTELIETSPHPWLVVEDSAHTYESATAVLEYFDSRLQPGDMFVLEDGILADLDGEIYRNLDDGPNRALSDFLRRRGSSYTIDTALCDFYGHNVTYAPNGWLTRT